MLSNPNQVEAVVWLLWVAFALVAISPVALLVHRPKRPPFANLGPSGDQLAPALKQLWSQHSTKPPPSQAHQAVKGAMPRVATPPVSNAFTT